MRSASKCRTCATILAVLLFLISSARYPRVKGFQVPYTGWSQQKNGKICGHTLDSGELRMGPKRNVQSPTADVHCTALCTSYMRVLVPMVQPYRLTQVGALVQELVVTPAPVASVWLVSSSARVPNDRQRQSASTPPGVTNVHRDFRSALDARLFFHSASGIRPHRA